MKNNNKILLLSLLILLLFKLLSFLNTFFTFLLTPDSMTYSSSTSLKTSFCFSIKDYPKLFSKALLFLIYTVFLFFFFLSGVPGFNWSFYYFFSSPQCTISQPCSLLEFSNEFTWFIITIKASKGKGRIFRKKIPRK